MFGEGARGRFRIEVPGRAQPPGSVLQRGGEQGLRAVGREQFGRTQALDFRLEGGAAGDFHDAEAAGRQIQPGETETSMAAADAGQQIVAPLFEQRVIGDGARGHDAHHFALHGTLGLAGDATLLANGDRLAFAHQLCQVAVESHDRHTGHGNRRAGRGAALGQGDIQQLRGAAGVVVEHLVEIAHAIEQQHVGVLRLDAQVLLHHRRVFVRGGRVIGHGEFD